MQKKENYSGIYQYSFHGKERRYIGSSFNLRKRHDQHMCLLRNGNHYIPDFQKDFITYGIENLKYEVIEFVDNSEVRSSKTDSLFRRLLLEKEQKFLDAFYAQEYLKDGKDLRFFKLMYNKSPLAEFNYSPANWKEVHKFSLKGEYIESFLNSEIASRCTKIDGASIKKVCYGQRKSAGNFMWSYNKDQSLSPYKNSCHRKIFQYDKKRNLINSFDSIAKASEATGIDIRKEKNSRLKSQGGYYWLFDGEDFPTYKRQTSK